MYFIPLNTNFLYWCSDLLSYCRLIELEEEYIDGDITEKVEWDKTLKADVRYLICKAWLVSLPAASAKNEKRNAINVKKIVLVIENLDMLCV